MNRKYSLDQINFEPLLDKVRIKNPPGFWEFHFAVIDILYHDYDFKTITVGDIDTIKNILLSMFDNDEMKDRLRGLDVLESERNNIYYGP